MDSAAPTGPGPAAPGPSVAGLLALRPQLAMHAMDGLCLEGVPLARIAADHGTPSYVYGAGTVRARIKALRVALADAAVEPAIHYAVKANDHLAILALMNAENIGADVVSGGEFARARRAGIPPARIVFSGVGKSPEEMQTALAAGIGQINVESAEELAILAAVATTTGTTARVTLRVNPDVDAGTHAKITTGRAGNKFGIAYGDIPDLYAHAATLPGIAPQGLAMHIGSQIASPAPYAAAFARMAALVSDLRGAGHAVRVLDLGGGLGIPYGDEPSLAPLAYAHAVRAAFGGLDLRLMMEPGRFLMGPAGLLLARVILQKQAGRRFVVLDAAMNDLLRPALYDAWHAIVPVNAADAARPATMADVVGPVCESADIFGADRALPSLSPGALVAILDTGAYGAAMASAYNARPLPASVLIDGGHAHLITPRAALATLWAAERIPPELAPQSAPQSIPESGSESAPGAP